MSGSHGRVVLTGRAWFGTALAASGLIAASGPNPAEACHITHHSKPAAEDLTSTAAPATPPATSPTDDFHKALQTFLKDWQQAVPATPPTITPTLTTTATPPAAQTLLPSTPTVANQGTSQPVSCPTPPPSTVPPSSTLPPPSTTPPASETLLPPARLINPTPAPEPSTVLSALAMIGAVAWRRRSARSRA
jgi:hypothetical protein